MSESITPHPKAADSAADNPGQLAEQSPAEQPKVDQPATSQTTPNADEPEASLARERSEAFESSSSFVRGAVGYFRQMARDAISVATGQVVEEELEANRQNTDSNTPAKTEDSDKRIGVLHGVAERLRGAADSYIAAKLDEIEARVDAKLDHIEERIDVKIAELNKQLAELRDQELRHRLRILKITLILTVIVAAISLAYRWLTSLAG